MEKEKGKRKLKKGEKMKMKMRCAGRCSWAGENAYTVATLRGSGYLWPAGCNKRERARAE